MNRDAGALVLDDHSGKFVEQPAQAGGEPFDARFGRGQIGMRGAFAVDLDLQAVQAGVIHVIGQAACARAGHPGAGR